jgi:glycosyltransferase involved in cell wall biosynthesis
LYFAAIFFHRSISFMIYFEATGACKSAMNTGMQRTSRRIFVELAKRLPVTPISWNWLGRHFHLLGPRELQILETPFLVESRPASRPDRRGKNLLAETNRFMFRKRVLLGDQLTSGDVFFVPDIYRDGRTHLFLELFRKTGAEGIAIFHDAAELELPKLYPGGAKSFRAYVESLAAFSHVICVSNASREHLEWLWRQFGLTPVATSVASWPIEFDQAERKESLPNDRCLIACVSSFEPRKNHVALLRAAEEVWCEGLQFELELIGRSTGYYGHKVIRQLERLQKAGRPVSWSKHVSDQTLHRAYRESRFTVYPSLMEGFGLPIAESLWHGKPVVCGGNGALGEIAHGGGCLIVDQTDEEALASGMKKLLTDQVAYERLCNEAHARKFRSWADYIDNLLEHLQVKPTAASVAPAALPN